LLQDNLYYFNNGYDSIFTLILREVNVFHLLVGWTKTIKYVLVWSTGKIFMMENVGL